MKGNFYIFLMIMTFCCPSLLFANDTDEQQDKRRRLFIEDFLDTYKAAYEKKEIDYIAQFFSTDALIITETKQLSKCGNEIVKKKKKKRPYKLIVEDKNEYIKRLRSIFKQNISIKLSISGCRVVRHTLFPELYGVSFLQLWTDQKGGNNLESQMPGYIFLMIDFKKNEMQPVLHVRTWQPRDNVKSPKDKFTLMDFSIYDF